MVRRNRCLRIAALLTSGSYLIIVAKSLIEAIHVLRFDVAADYQISIVLGGVARLVGAAGWAVVASSFGRAVDWRRLRTGAAIVICFYVGSAAATVFDALPKVPGGSHDIHDYFVWTSIGALLLAAAALVATSGFGDSSRGGSRASRLQLGLGVATASAVAATVAALDYQSYYSAQGFPHQVTIGALAAAIGQGGVALATLTFCLGARWPLPRREARLAPAAAGAAVATVLIAAGQVSLALYASDGEFIWQKYTFWLGAVYTVVAVVIFIAIALGARSVVSAEGLGATEQ